MELGPEDFFLTSIIEAGIPTVKEYELINALKYLREDLHFFNVNWINNISKSPHNAVNVIENNSDMVLFQVPPMIILKSDPNKLLGKELSKVRLEIDNTPALRNILIANSLSANLSIIADTSEVREGWKAMLIRYGYEDMLDVDEIVNSDQEKVSTNNSLSFFDD
jgi:hypothetical protein